MPFQSEAQRRYFRWAESKGKLPPGTSDAWESETPKDKKLPEKLKSADAGGAMPFAVIGNSPSSGYNYIKPATPPVAKLPLKSPAPVPPAPASNPQMFAPSTAKAAAQKYPVYHHCKECKATYGGARGAQPNIDLAEVFGTQVQEVTAASYKRELSNQIDSIFEAAVEADEDEGDDYPSKVGYKVIALPSIHGMSAVENIREAEATKLEDFLNQKGKEGWILCTIQQGHGIFMRLDPKEEILK